jgi:hypothetical protein
MKSNRTEARSLVFSSPVVGLIPRVCGVVIRIVLRSVEVRLFVAIWIRWLVEGDGIKAVRLSVVLVRGLFRE